VHVLDLAERWNPVDTTEFTVIPGTSGCVTPLPASGSRLVTYVGRAGIPGKALPPIPRSNPGDTWARNVQLTVGQRAGRHC